MNMPANWQKTLLVICFIIGGCATIPSQDPAFYDNPGLHFQHDTSVSMNWLAIAGAVTIAFGVAGYMNGQKAATSILAAGVTLLATGIVITQALSFFAEFRIIAFGVLITLGIVGFFVFAGTSLDWNKDGKTNWRDVLYIFTKIKIKPKKP